MSFTFPHQFDTTAFAKLVFQTARVLIALVLASGVISLAIKLLAGAGLADIIVTLAAMALLCAIITGIGLVMFKKLGGVSGTITDRDVSVSAATVGGYIADEPTGIFPLAAYEAVRLERINTKGRRTSHERVFLQARTGEAPDIFVATGRRGSGDSYAQQLGQLLKLPVQEKMMPY
jgi:hypothetical protein